MVFKAKQKGVKERSWNKDVMWPGLELGTSRTKGLALANRAILAPAKI